MKKNKKIIIIISDFYSELSELLLSDTTNTLIENKIKKENILTYKVSGVFELPGAVSYASRYHDIEAIIALGVVIKGETPHFDFISAACANSISKLTIKNKFPITFGVLTTNTYKQALKRSQEKGVDIANTTLQSIQTYKKIKTNKS